MEQADFPNLPRELLEELPYAIFAIDPQNENLIYTNAAGKKIMQDPDNVNSGCYRSIFSGDKTTCVAYRNTTLDIFNRRKFDVDFKKALSEKNAKGAVVLLNLKGFNKINQKYGYDQANNVLVGIAAHLRNNLPVTDAVYHNASDKFLFLLPDISEEMLKRFLFELSGSFENPWQLGSILYPVTCDIAAISYPEHGKNASELMQNLYSALEISRKSNVSNAITYFSQSINEEAQKRAKIEWEMSRAILENFEEFEVHYQPVIEAKSLKWQGCEALLRWRSKELGYLMPGSFLEVAEQTGMIKQLGIFVLKTSALFIKSLNLPEDSPFHLGYNVSVQQLYDPGFTDDVKGVLEETGFDPKRLILEIVRLNEKDRSDPMVKKNLKNLKTLGSCVALDNFGLDNREVYDFDGERGFIKIGRYVAAGIESDYFMPVFLNTIIDLSKAMNLDICAKGIETEKQLNVMRDYDCAYLQGYHISQPLDENEFRKQLPLNM